MENIENQEVENSDNISTITEEDLARIEEFQKEFLRAHTPWIRRYRRVSRNEVCPFCGSGKKFKNCKCYEQVKNVPIYTLQHVNV